MALAISSSPTADDLIDPPAAEGEGLLAGAAHGDAVGDGGRRGYRARGSPPAQAASSRPPPSAWTPITSTPGLRPSWPLRSRRSAAAAHRHQHRFEVGNLRGQLEPDGALARDDARVVEAGARRRGRARPRSRGRAHTPRRSSPRGAPPPRRCRRAAVTLVSGAHSGMTMTAQMPSRAAWKATARPWFPALARRRRRARRSAGELQEDVGGAALLEGARSSGGSPSSTKTRAPVSIREASASRRRASRGSRRPGARGRLDVPSVTDHQAPRADIRNATELGWAGAMNPPA